MIWVGFNPHTHLTKTEDHIPLTSQLEVDKGSDWFKEVQDFVWCLQEENIFLPSYKRHVTLVKAAI